MTFFPCANTSRSLILRNIVHLARNPALRTPVINERKTNARSYSQNLRWTKQSAPEDPLGAVGSAATVNGSNYNAAGANRAVSATSQRSTPVGLAASASRRRHLLPPHQQLHQQRRSTVESVSKFYCVAVNEDAAACSFYLDLCSFSLAPRESY